MPINKHEGALFANESYNMLRKVPGQRNRLANIDFINKNIFNTGYRVVDDRKHTNKDMVTYINDEGHIHISHRGTDMTGSQTGKDVSTWLPIARGATSENKHFVRRQRMTDRTLEAFPDAEYVTGSSHSYGGSSLYSALLGSQIARDRFDKIHTYNAGASLFRTANETALSPEARKQLKGIVTHHRVEGDVVSGAWATRKPLVGEVKTIKRKKTGMGMALDTFLTLTANQGVKSTRDAALSHGLDHFYKAEKYRESESEDGPLE